MNALKNIKITVKTFGGFAVVMTLLLLIGGGAVFALNGGSDTFARYRQLARQSSAMADVEAEVIQTRLNVKDFLIRQDKASADAVLASVSAADESVGRALSFVMSEEKRDLLDGAIEDLQLYGERFREVVAQQSERDELVHGTLNTLGPSIREKLSEVMESAYADDDAEAAYLAGEAQQRLMLARYYVQRFLIENSREDYARVHEELDKTEEGAATLLAALQSPTRRQLVQEVIEGTKTYEATFESVFSTINRRNAIISGELDVIGPKVMAAAGKLMDLAQDEQDELGPRATAAMQTAVISLAVAVAVALLLGAAAAWLIGTGIARPIGAMTAAMQRLAEGDKTVEIPAVGRKDEVGEMAEAVKVFKDSMIEAERLAAEQAKAQEAQIARAKRLDELTRNFDAAVAEVLQSVSGAAEEMQATAQSMSAIADQTKSQAGSASSASTQASANVQTVASAAEELSGASREIARQVEQSSDMSKNAVGQAQQTHQTVQQLAKAAEKIGEVVTLIQDIAEQTNLLALNATIEAARAGEAGKGFAVVASEVKSLATQTGKATEEIAQQIAEIQNSTSGAVSAIEGIAGMVEELNGIAASISAAVEEQTAATAEIARNVQEAATGTSEVTQTLTGVNGGADETSRAASQVLDAVGELTRQTEGLRREVDGFLNGVKAA
jgi:methyl-accepting chemotaxis protein